MSLSNDLELLSGVFFLAAVQLLVLELVEGPLHLRRFGA
jgi:hypothetical protein